MNNKKQIRILFVCMGNICRSPTAHGVFENLVRKHQLDEQIYVDSAGTHAYHVGESPDRRSQQTAHQHGVDLSYIRARKVRSDDFEEFDYILAMDHDNYDDLYYQSPEQYRDKIQLFMHYAPDELLTHVVPDPYYGGKDGFENVFKLVELASIGLLNHLQNKGA